jgi:hypothetical protein
MPDELLGLASDSQAAFAPWNCLSPGKASLPLWLERREMDKACPRLLALSRADHVNFWRKFRNCKMGHSLVWLLDPYMTRKRLR